MTKIPPDEEALFDAAHNLQHPAARRAFLDQGLRERAGVARAAGKIARRRGGLRRFFPRTPPGFSAPPAQDAAESERGRDPDFPFTEGCGSHIGHYKILQKIGEGGCGVVYMADQEEPVRRRVALKIIKLGMDTKSVIARFEAERQALALMDHPNIARVLDAGATETGRPYFVMELVRGVKITDYCDENKLDTRQRLACFIQICRPSSTRTQKGIIHRDIKPSNIMVTQHDGVPVPKVIDLASRGYRNAV